MTKRLVSVDSVCGIPIDDRKQPYKSDFWARICFWAESNGYFVFDCYETCLDMGDGTYGQCKTYYFQFRKSDESSSTIEHDDNRVPNDDGVLTESQHSYEKKNNQVLLYGG